MICCLKHSSRGGKPTSNFPCLTWEMQSEAARSHKEIILHVVIDLLWWKQISAMRGNADDRVVYNPARIITTPLFNECWIVFECWQERLLNCMLVMCGRWCMQQGHSYSFIYMGILKCGYSKGFKTKLLFIPLQVNVVECTGWIPVRFPLVARPVAGGEVSHVRSVWMLWLFG